MLFHLFLLLVRPASALFYQHTGWYFNQALGRYVYEEYPELEEVTSHNSDEGCEEKFAAFKEAELRPNQFPSRYSDDPVIESILARTMSDEDYKTAKTPDYGASGASDRVREGCK